MNHANVIILGAGQGTRMKSKKPKVLHEIANFPMLKIVNIIAERIASKKDIINIISDEVQAHANFKINNPIVQKEKLGTGHAVLSAKDATHPDHKTVFIISNDQPLISRETIEEIINAHSQGKQVITMGTVVLPDFNDWRGGAYFLGRIIRNESGKVIKITEYKDATEKEREIKEINPAIYAFDAVWLWKHINELKNQNSAGEYYLTDLIKIAEEEGRGIEAIPVSNMMEIFQPNSKPELEILEGILANNA
jgi:bifunctional UDP-N-acetylglucosamine pyrophosphorylase/glucosamine-1-phosphate N-acetyltransferase